MTAIYRPSFTLRQRLAQVVLGPVYPVLGIMLLRPASYWALTKLRSTSWHTRGAEHTGTTSAAGASPAPAQPVPPQPAPAQPGPPQPRATAPAA